VAGGGTGFLNVNPTSINAGPLAVGSTVDFSLLLGAVGAVFINNITVSGGSGISFPGLILPVDLTGGGSYLLTVRISASTLGTFSRTVVIDSDATNNPVNIPVTWQTVTSTVPRITVDPTSWDFGNEKVGVPSAEKLFTVHNTGSVNASVTGYTFPTGFAIGGTNPSLPQTLTPGSTYQFGVVFNPIVEGFTSGALAVASNDPSSPFNILLSGTGYLIDPVVIIPGVQPELFMAAFKAPSGSANVRSNDISAGFAVDFNTEEPATVMKLHNFEQIAADKLIKYFWYHFEDLGQASWTASFRDRMTATVKSIFTTLGSLVPSLFVFHRIFEVGQDGENIEVRFDRAANDGPLSFVDWGFKFEPQGFQLDTFPNPLSLTPVVNMVDCPEFLTFGLSGTGHPIQFFDVPFIDPDVVGPPATPPARFSNALLLPFPTQQGEVPGFTYEKQVMRIHFHYEDWGPAVVRWTIGTMRGQESHQDVNIGTTFANRCLKEGIADVTAVDEVIEITCERVSGPVVIADYTLMYESKGERAKKVETIDSLVSCDPFTTPPPCPAVEPVIPPPQIITACPVGPLQVGVFQSFTLQAQGGVPPYFWEIVEGGIPGMTLAVASSTTAVLSGTPTTPGTFSYRIRLSDSG